jgi:hypothetical protein
MSMPAAPCALVSAGIEVRNRKPLFEIAFHQQRSDESQVVTKVSERVLDAR